jgi:hypothetical protein
MIKSSEYALATLWWRTMACATSANLNSIMQDPITAFRLSLYRPLSSLPGSMAYLMFPVLNGPDHGNADPGLFTTIKNVVITRQKYHYYRMFYGNQRLYYIFERLKIAHAQAKLALLIS